MHGASILFRRQVAGLTDQRLEVLDRNDIRAIHRLKASGVHRLVRDNHPFSRTRTRAGYKKMTPPLFRPRPAKHPARARAYGVQEVRIVAKNRHGQTGKAHLQWDAPLTRFSDLAPSYVSAPPPEASQASFDGHR